MAIPNVSITVNAGGIGIILPGTGPLPVNVMGSCSQGTPATPNTFGAAAVSALTSMLGVGPAVELAAAILANGAPSVIVTRIFDGTVAASFTHTGGGSGTVAGSGSPMGLYGTATAGGSTGPIILISTSGGLGVGAFQVSLDGGNTYSPAQSIPSGGIYLIPNTGITATFAGTFTATDTYTGAITSTKGASSSVSQRPVPGQSLQGSGSISMDTLNNPQDAYNVVVLIIATGVVGVGQYSFSLDGGLTFSNTILIPSSNPSVLGSSGIQIDWSNSGGGGATSGFVIGETYLFTTTPPTITATDVTNVATFIQGNAAQWDWAHIVGRPTSISNSTGLFSTLSTLGAQWFAANRFSFFVMETPADTTANNIDAALISAFASLSSDYVSVGAGDANIVSALSGSEVQRNASWAASIFGATQQVGTDLAAPALGNLPFIAALLRDENVTQGLDAARFTTLRTIPTLSGFFITNARIMCATSSNILYWQSRRVLNVACRVAYQVLVQLLSRSILVNASTGTIDPKAAVAIQNSVVRAINQALTGQITGSSCIVSQTNNVLTTQQLNVTIGLIPLFYPKFISATIGYVNPAISTL